MCYSVMCAVENTQKELNNEIKRRQDVRNRAIKNQKCWRQWVPRSWTLDIFSGSDRDPVQLPAGLRVSRISAILPF